MADPHHGGEHHGPGYSVYMTIAVALAVCTASSFLVNRMVEWKTLTVVMGFLLILGVAIIKATLVGLYFMHLKWDWRMLYFIIVPAFIMGTMMMVVLMPDILLGPSHDASDAIVIAAEYDKAASR